MGTWSSVKRFLRDRKAISGIETAIVLIAFVIVASGFAYAVMNMGFLATQKSQQVVSGGLAAASSALVVDGPVYGYSTAPGSNGNLTSVIFWLATASGTDSVDLSVNRTMIELQNPRGLWPNVYNTNGGTLDYSANGMVFQATASATVVTWETGGQGVQLMPGQRVRVTIDLTQLTMMPTNPTGVGGCFNQAEGCQYAGEIMKDEQFTVVIKPPVGSMLEIDRVAPAEIAQVNDLG